MATKQEMMFSVLAVKQGLITPDKVQECMDIQRRFAEEKNQNVSLIKIFVAKKYLSLDQVKKLQAPEAPKSVSLEKAQEIPEFDVIEKIGEGGVATVFRAVHKQSNFECALKIMFPIHAQNPTFRDRFMSEARMLKEFDHSNIVKGLDYGIYPDDDSVDPGDKLYYLAMELVPGRSVQDDINEFGKIDDNKALHIIIQIAEALEYLHEKNVVHRDIKPDNILYDDFGNIKLCDLGFAKEVETGDGEVEGTTCGTVQYISPEQARGVKDVDIRADIYSLGATLFHLMVGEPPFSGNDAMEIMAAQVLNPLESDKYRGKNIGKWMGYFIEKMMAKDREMRYQTPREAIEDIQSILQGASELQYNPETDPEVQKFGKYKGKPVSKRSTRKLGPPPKRKTPTPNAGSGKLKPNMSTGKLNLKRPPLSSRRRRKR